MQTNIPKRYTFSVVVTALAVVLTALLRPFLEHSVFLFFYGGIALVVSYAGFRAGLLSVFMSMLSTWYFLAQPVGFFQLTAQNGVTLILFVMVATLICVVAGHRDLKAERKTESHAKVKAEAVEVEETFKLLVGAVKDYAIFMLDPDGIVKTWNEGAQRIKGYRSEEIIGKHYSTFYPTESARAGEPQRLLEKAKREGHVETQAIRVRKDGTTFFADVVITSLYDANGVLKGFAKVTRDITERRKAEEALHRKEEELLQSQKIEAIGRLAGGIAHDYNNLMTGIRGLTESIIEEGGPVSRHESDLAAIVNATNRATELTRQLLAFGRKQIVHPVVVNLNHIVRDMTRLLGQLLGEDIELKIFLHPESGRIKADPGQLEQVLINLLINARDAMPQGGKISIEVISMEMTEADVHGGFDIKPGPYVCLVVTDTGSGMSHEIQQHIFEPFFTTKDKEKGTGLGLAMVHGIMKQSGGEISFDSQPGRGTTFRLYFPSVSEALPEDLAIGMSAIAAGKETILVVEDEQIVRHVAVKALRKAGYQVFEARNGKEAMEFSAGYKKPIDLLLTDVVMPIMNGRTLAEFLMVKRPELKVLYMSGFTEGVIVDRGILEPGIAFIEKTFTNKSLTQRVRTVLDSKTTSPKLQK